jgi:hypothetical protein
VSFRSAGGGVAASDGWLSVRRAWRVLEEWEKSGSHFFLSCARLMPIMVSFGDSRFN